MNISLIQVPDTVSRISLVAFTIATVGNINGIDQVVDQIPIVEEDAFLSDTKKNFQINRTLSPPDEVDRFFLNVTILARTVGNVTQVENQVFTVRFPDSGTIFVSRDALAPLVNLYGFPPGSFFQKWLPVYAFFIFLLLIPAFTMGISYARRSISKTKDVKTEDQTNTSSEKEESQSE